MSFPSSWRCSLKGIFWGHRVSWLTSVRMLKVLHSTPVSRWCAHRVLKVCLWLVRLNLEIETVFSAGSAWRWLITLTVYLFMYFWIVFLLFWVLIMWDNRKHFKSELHIFFHKSQLCLKDLHRFATYEKLIGFLHDTIKSVLL